MSSPRYPWWPSAVRMVQNFPTWKAELEQLHSQSVSAGEGGIPSGGEVSRKTENIALRQLPPRKQEELDAVNKAIEITSMMPDGDRRVKLIRLMYWKGRKLRIVDVIDPVGVAEATGWRWHSAFIELVGICAGYER